MRALSSLSVGALAATLVLACLMQPAFAAHDFGLADLLPQSLSVDDLRPHLDRAHQLWLRFRDWLLAGYQRVPMLVLGLAALIVLPPLAIIGLAIHRRVRASAGRTAAGRDWRDGKGWQFTDDKPAPAERVYLEIEGDPATRLPLGRSMVSIGRSEDNAMRLASKTVHRYHAVIHWTPETDYVITDLSGEAGNGVLLNGTRVTQSALRNGDLVELGEVRIRFVAAPI